MPCNIATSKWLEDVVNKNNNFWMGFSYEIIFNFMDNKRSMANSYIMEIKLFSSLVSSSSFQVAQNILEETMLEKVALRMMVK